MAALCLSNNLIKVTRHPLRPRPCVWDGEDVRRTRCRGHPSQGGAGLEKGSWRLCAVIHGMGRKFRAHHRISEPGPQGRRGTRSRSLSLEQWGQDVDSGTWHVQGS